MKKIILKNFKCFEYQEVEFKNLTVLSGINGSGKSTVIHSMLLLLQSQQPYYSLVLNGYYLEAGIAKNILYHNAKEDIISFLLEFDKGSVEFSYMVDETNERIIFKDKDIKNTPNEKHLITSNEEFIKRQYYIENFVSKVIDFISADRYGPRLQYPVSNMSRKVGKFGEFTPYVINEFKDEIIKNKKIYFNKDIKTSSLLSEINNWFSYILDGVKINTKTLEEVNISLLEITNYPSSILDFTSPIHMPYGASYILPIIVSCLMASFVNKSIVIIENPESHLHPSAQSKLGEFFSVCADAGIQIILETHSDHIINGIRKGVKKGIVSNEEVLFNFFSKGDNLGEHKLHKIEINKDAQLFYWPKGFFDQYENDLMDLI
jgi:predicted ATPase